MLYHALIYPYLNYGIVLWGSTYPTYRNIIFLQQKKAVRCITGAKYRDHTSPIFKECQLLKLDDIYKLEVVKFVYLFMKSELPTALNGMFALNSSIHGRLT